MKTYLLDAIEKNNIIPLIELKPYLWKDEINDLFILTKQMELYLYLGYKTETIDKSVLGCYSWSWKIAFQLLRKEKIYDFWSTDDVLLYIQDRYRKFTPDFITGNVQTQTQYYRCMDSIQRAKVGA